MISARLDKKSLSGPLLLLATLLPLPAGADLISFSLAAVSGSAKYKQENSPQNFSVDIQTLGLRGSVNFLDLLHLDAEYATSPDRHNFSSRGVSSNAKFDNLSLWMRVGIPFPVPVFDAYAMIGFSNLDPKYSNSAIREPSLNQGAQYGLGLALQFPALPLELILEYVLRTSQEYDLGASGAGKAEYSSLNVGARWNF